MEDLYLITTTNILALVKWFKANRFTSSLKEAKDYVDARNFTRFVNSTAVVIVELTLEEQSSLSEFIGDHAVVTLLHLDQVKMLRKQLDQILPPEEVSQGIISVKVEYGREDQLGELTLEVDNITAFESLKTLQLLDRLKDDSRAKKITIRTT